MEWYWVVLLIAFLIYVVSLFCGKVGEKSAQD